MVVVIQYASTYLTVEAVNPGDSAFPYDEDGAAVTRASTGQGRAPSMDEVNAALTKAREINELKREIKMTGRQSKYNTNFHLFCLLYITCRSRDESEKGLHVYK